MALKFGIFFQTSSFPSHEATNILESEEHTFWVTTGLYPQEVILKADGDDLTKLSKITWLSSNVRKLVIESSNKTQPVNWVQVLEIELEKGDQRLQKETFNLETPIETRFLRFRIMSGWDHFSSVHSVEMS